MKIENLMTRRVAACGQEDNLDQAARLMWENDCGCVPVTDRENRVVGMLTDRDVCMAAWTRHARLDEIPAREIMSREVVAVTADEPVAKAENLMKQRQVRRLPVVDRQRRLVGIVSLNDLARRCAAPGVPHKEVPLPLDVAETLAAVCRPHACILPSAPQETGHLLTIAH